MELLKRFGNSSDPKSSKPQPINTTWRLVIAAISGEECILTSLQKVIFVGGLSQSPFMHRYLDARILTESRSLGYTRPIALITPDTVYAEVLCF